MRGHLVRELQPSTTSATPTSLSALAVAARATTPTPSLAEGREACYATITATDTALSAAVQRCEVVAQFGSCE